MKNILHLIWWHIKNMWTAQIPESKPTPKRAVKRIEHDISTYNDLSNSSILIPKSARKNERKQLIIGILQWISHKDWTFILFVIFNMIATLITSLINSPLWITVLISPLISFIIDKAILYSAKYVYKSIQRK